MRLIVKLVFGVLLGVVAGLWAPELLIRTLLTFKELFSQFIGYIIPLIILFFIMSGVSSLEKNSGKILAITVALAYISTLIAGLGAYSIARISLPSFISESHFSAIQGQHLAPFIVLKIPPFMDVMTALVTAFIFGIGVSVHGGKELRAVVDQGKQIVEWILHRLFIPLLPLYIAGVFAQMAVEGIVFHTLQVFAVVLSLVLVMQWAWLVTIYLLGGSITGRKPLQMLKSMLPAYFTALGSMSSAAAIPVTLAQVKRNGVDSRIANFTVPLCATIHISGSAITLVTCAYAVMMISGMPLPGYQQMIPFVLLLGITLVAAPGAPGGGVMAALGILSAVLGFDDASLALMIALYIAQDSFGTACNVTGDGIIAALVDKYQGLNRVDSVGHSTTYPVV